MNPEAIEQRLSDLRSEHEKGREQLRELNARTVELEQQLLRIGGAIQVLEELMDPQTPED